MSICLIIFQIDLINKLNYILKNSISIMYSNQYFIIKYLEKQIQYKNLNLLESVEMIDNYNIYV